MKRYVSFFLCSIFLFFNVAYAGDYFKGMSYVDKTECTIWAQLGTKHALKDRADKAGHNGNKRKWRVADEVMAKGGKPGYVAEVMSCYEQGYDMGYYDR